MKIYSFKEAKAIARITDPAKIKNIKLATIEIIVENGYGGANIADIAKKAGVSTGYLYRHYANKEELVQELIYSLAEEFFKVMEHSLKHHNQLRDVIYHFNSLLFTRANNKPVETRFLNRIFFEDYFIKYKKKNKDKDVFLKGFRDKGIKTGEINSILSDKEFYAIFPTIPMRYIGIILNESEGTKMGEEEVKRITDICLKALK